ncbi:hypothetical protein TDB9533_00797 [Thalassocella blandensis]|nr:hypothetical protein TDB9533_00797 [Thalassocella blandensis]
MNIESEITEACPVIWKKSYEGTIVGIKWQATASLEKCNNNFYMQVDAIVLGNHHRFKLPVTGNTEKYITIDGVKGWYKISGYSLTSSSIRFQVDIQVQFVFWYNVVSDWVVANFSKLENKELSSLVMEHAQEIEGTIGLKNIPNEIWNEQDPL